MGLQSAGGWCPVSSRTRFNRCGVPGKPKKENISVSAGLPLRSAIEVEKRTRWAVSESSLSRLQSLPKSCGIRMVKLGTGEHGVSITKQAGQ